MPGLTWHRRLAVTQDASPSTGRFGEWRSALAVGYHFEWGEARHLSSAAGRIAGEMPQNRLWTGLSLGYRFVGDDVRLELTQFRGQFVMLSPNRGRPRISVGTWIRFVERGSGFMSNVWRRWWVGRGVEGTGHREDVPVETNTVRTGG